MDKKRIDQFIEKRDIRDYLVSILTGVFVGLFCILFRYAILLLTNMRYNFLTGDVPVYMKIPLFMLIVYVVLLLIGRLIHRVPEIAGNGAEQTRCMLNGHLNRKKSIRKLLLKFVGSTGSLGAGMGLGHEGPSIQFGAYLGIFTSRLCRTTKGREENIISAGASAGVAAALNAPLAGPVYIIESLQKLNNYRMAICVLLAGLTGGLIAFIFMPQNPYGQIPLVRPEVGDIGLLILLVCMGGFSALIGLLFNVVVKFVRNRFYASKQSPKLYLFLLVCYMGFIGFYMPGMLGSGQPFMIDEAVFGKTDLLQVFLVALFSFIFTAYSQGTIFPGGAFLPLLTLGGLSGRLYGLIVMQLGYCGVESLPYFMFLGMCACFIVVIRTPLTGFLLVTEMTGRFEILLPALAVGITGYFLVSVVRLQSLPESLYQMLLERINPDKEEQTLLYTEVMPYSYLEGKSAQNIGLPEGCQVVAVLRLEKRIDFSGNQILQAGDQIEFSVKTREVEQVYQALIALSSDLD